MSWGTATIGPSDYTLEVLPGRLAVCRLDASAEAPDWVTGEFVSVTRTAAELSVVCSQDTVPGGVRCEPGWRCLRVAGPLDFSMVGVIAALAGTLAAARISVFVISTFDTDCLLVKEADLAKAVASLTGAGHAVSNPA